MLENIEEERDLFFSHSIDLLAVVDPDGYFKRINPAFTRTLGYAEEEFYSKPLTYFLHPDDVSKTQDVKGASKNRYRCKDGTYKWFSWNTIPMGTFFFSIGRDITDQIAFEESIRQLNTELEKKNEDLEKKIQDRVDELRKSEAQILHLQKMDAVGTLAGGVAHDFNNILGAIQMYCELIEDEAHNTEQVRTCIRQVQAASNKGAALTRQLLLFSRQLIQQLEPIQLNDLIKNHFKMLNRLIREDIKIVTKFADDLPMIEADYGQIEQVIMNLVINAKDAMPSGGEITIETSFLDLREDFTSTDLTVTSGPTILLSVSDTGKGMDEKTKSKLFEPFFTTKDLGKGAGLGLSTVYGIVKASRGSISVHSELGKGSVFKIYFPVTDKTSVGPESQEKRVTDFKGHETILLVEDDEELRILCERSLLKQGYKILKANNGQEALDLIKSYEGNIDLIITDIIMPEMGGVELAKLALNVKPALKILYMSGYTNETIEILFENADDQNFIQKPFSGKMLSAKVRELLPTKS